MVGGVLFCLVVFNSAFDTLFKASSEHKVFMYINLARYRSFFGQECSGWHFFYFLHDLVGARVNYFRVSGKECTTVALRNYLFREGHSEIASSFPDVSNSGLIVSGVYNFEHVQSFDIEGIEIRLLEAGEEEVLKPKK